MSTNKDIFYQKGASGYEIKAYVKRKLIETSFSDNSVIDGGFDSTSYWNTDTGNWQIFSSGYASCVTVSGSSDSIMYQGKSATALTDLEEFSLYKISFDLLNHYYLGTFNGNLQVKLGNTESEVISTTGSKEIYLYCRGSLQLTFVADSNFIGSIDNVTMQKVNVLDDDFIDISSKLNDDSLGSITKKLPDNFYEYGQVTFGTSNLTVSNNDGYLSNEDNENSLFYGYQRHNSVLKVTAQLTDSNDEYTIFEGLIDDILSSTNDDGTEILKAKDPIKKLEEYTLEDIGTITSTTVNDFVYEVLNRQEFYGFFSVQISDIHAGYNTTDLDFSQYDDGTKIIDIFKDLSYGHSIFYVRDEFFIFKPIVASSTIAINLGLNPERKIRTYGYSNGAKNVIEKLYWEDSTEKYESSSEKFRTSKIINIDSITDTTQRQNLLNFIGGNTSQQKISFKVDIPFMPNVEILDQIYFERKEADQMKIDPDNIYYTKGLLHSGGKTTLTIEYIDEAGGVIDDIRDGVAGFGLTKLNSFYEGSAIRIRRNNYSNSAELNGVDDEIDVGFSDGSLDWVAVKNFLKLNAGSNDECDEAFIVTLYDQSNEGNHATQSNSAKQARLNIIDKTIDFNGKENNYDLTTGTKLFFGQYKDFSVFDNSITNSYIEQFVFGKLSSSFVGNPQGWGSRWAADGKKDFIADISLPSRIVESTDIEIDTWSDWLATFLRNTDLSLYKNETFQETEIYGSTNVDTAALTTATIGLGQADTAGYFNGKLSIILVFEKVLNTYQKEIANDFSDAKLPKSNYPTVVDEIGSVATCYSLKRERQYWTGPCLKIRRNNSDDTAVSTGSNDEIDIYFDGAGALDWPTVLTFLDISKSENDESDTAYVTTWYDQSGLSNNATQTTASYQPILDGTKKEIRLGERVLGTYGNTHLSVDRTLTNAGRLDLVSYGDRATALCEFRCSRDVALGTNSRYLFSKCTSFGGGGDGYCLRQRNLTYMTFHYDATSTLNTINATYDTSDIIETRIISLQLDGGNFRYYIDADWKETLYPTNIPVDGTAQDFTIGSRSSSPTGSNYLVGSMKRLIIFNKVLTEDEIESLYGQEFEIGVSQIGGEDFIPALNETAVDVIGDTAGIFSLALETIEYKGPCVRIRRNNSTDTATSTGANDEVYIYFFGKHLDWPSVHKFLTLNSATNVESDTAYITTWYNQDSAGTDAVQTTASMQPLLNLISKRIQFTGSARPSNLIAPTYSKIQFINFNGGIFTTCGKWSIVEGTFPTIFTDSVANGYAGAGYYLYLQNSTGGRYQLRYGTPTNYNRIIRYIGSSNAANFTTYALRWTVNVDCDWFENDVNKSISTLNNVGAYDDIVTPLYIGSSAGGTNYLEGEMSQLIFFNKELTDDEISNLYAEESKYL